MRTFSKTIKFKVAAISLAVNEERGKLGLNDSRIPAYMAGMEPVHCTSGDDNYFPFMPSHITAILLEHPNIGDVYTITLAKEEEQK